MNKKTLTPRFLFIIAVIAFAALYRMLPHLPNFTPVAAMALFSGAMINKKGYAFIIPLVAMILSDLVIGLHSTIWAVYLSFAITVGLGLLISKKQNIVNIALGSVASSVIFFLLTNFAVWTSGMVGYTLNFAGLVSCYVAAIPFFRNEFLGTMVFNTVFFGSLYFAQKKFTVLAKA